MIAHPSLIPNVHDPHVGASLQPESGMVDRQPARFIIGTDFQDVGLLGVAEVSGPQPFRPSTSFQLCPPFHSSNESIQAALLRLCRASEEASAGKTGEHMHSACCNDSAPLHL